MDMAGSYDVRLVVLSLLVAVATSYTALDLAGRVASAGGRPRVLWLGGGAIVMGFGIWSMHFVAMLAFALPVAMSYDLPTVLLSVLVAVAASALALFVASRAAMSVGRSLVGGLIMGLAIASMHYVGMAAMRPRMAIRYDPTIFTLSIVVAVAASVAALRIAFALRGGDGRRQGSMMAGSALVMGGAIAGMHYTGMAATSFTATGDMLVPTGAATASSWLGAVAIAGGTFVVLGIALLTSQIDRRSGARLRAEVAERRRVEEALTRSEAEFRLVFQRNPHPMWINDAETLAFLEVNDAAVSHYGYSRDEFLGMRIVDIVPGEERHRLSDGALHDQPAREQSGAWKHRLADGRTIDVEVTSHTLEFRGRAAALVVAQDVTARRSLETRLEHQAFHDPLTGLVNRRRFLDRLGLALGGADGRRGGVAVLFLDLDRFKLVNDSLGHEVGDQLLIAVADRLVRCSRPQDTVARFGGDEFAVLLNDLEDPAEAGRVAERLAEELRRPFELDGRRLSVGASVGIAVNETAGAHAHDLLRDADIAMYRAKAQGGAGQEVFDAEMGVSAGVRLDREVALRRGVEQGQFRLDYQPLVDLTDGSIVGMEALVRWDHPENGAVAPDAFIALAEETGQIVPLGRWVLEEACRQGRRWQEMHPGRALEVAVNLSARQLCHPELVEQVAGALAASGLGPASLMLELTETAVMEDAPRSMETLRSLKALGVRLAIDDFGTGYSSLAYLKRFPVDVLKIDRAFVGGLAHNPEDSAIVAAIVTLAHILGVQVVAEGIETADQLAALQELGCDTGQGFLFTRPQSPAALADLLAGTSPWAITPITAGAKVVSLAASRRARGA